MPTEPVLGHRLPQRHEDLSDTDAASRPTLLVMRSLGLGDLLTGVPALRGLARHFPDHRKLLITPDAWTDVVAATGAGYEVIHHPRVLDARFWDISTAPTLATMGITSVDVAVNLQDFEPVTHEVLLRTNPKRYVAFGDPRVAATRGFPEWGGDEPEPQRWVRMLQHFDIAADPNDLDLDLSSLPDRTSSINGRGAVVLNPATASVAKNWPVDSWVELASRFHNQGRTVLVTGGPGDAKLAKHIAKAAGLSATQAIAGVIPLSDVIRVIAEAELLITGDTGTAHIATAVGCPSVIIFGPANPLVWGPPRDRSQHRVLWAGFEGEIYADATFHGMHRITVDHVGQAARQVQRAAEQGEGLSW